MSYLEWAQRLGPTIPYTRKFAAMIGAGVSLARTLELLQETTDDPALAAANAALTEKVMAGRTLSSVMAEMPEHFSSFYVAFVRAGEVGGVLDETLADLADWLEQEQAAAERFLIHETRLDLIAYIAGGLREEGGEAGAAAIEESRRYARVASFCRLFERCLTAGVPLKMALTTAAGVLRESAAAQIRRAAEALGPDEPIAPVLAGIEELQPIVTQMVAIGEETGFLPLMLRKASEAVEAEALYRLRRAPFEE